MTDPGTNERRSAQNQAPESASIKSLIHDWNIEPYSA
jgi:hypothetical protein